ncbi:MAG: BamA/TamA family outer membrane protein [Candidatus Poribacteria bacterium]|nr:BamA/TamA family outer membrane protein [Candidatus Poribacteria bacterium]
MRTLITFFLTGILSLSGIRYPNPFHAQSEVIVDNSNREHGEVSASQFPVNLHSASEQVISYDDVYGIGITLPFDGDVAISALEGNRIIIKLDKQAIGINEEIVQRFLDAVKLGISRVEDTVQITPQLPDGFETEANLTRINCRVEVPPDISVRIHTSNGNVHVGGLRGVLNIAANVGDIQFSETMGQYQVALTEGRIFGRIFLTKGKNSFETQSGSIDLTILDSVAAPMDFTAVNGGIRLRLPQNFPADVEINNEKRDRRTIFIEVPAEIDHSLTGDVLHGAINGGGPLIRLHASDQVAVLAGESSLPDRTEAGEDNLLSDGLLHDENDTATIPTAAVSKTEVPPRIDGNLFEKTWSNTLSLHDFYEADGIHPAREPTQVFLMWDDRFLYIGVRAYDAQMGEVHVSQRTKDSAVGTDDSIEILVDPNPQTPLYYHLIINPIGTVLDQIVRSNYSPDAQIPSVDAGEKPMGLTSSNGIVDLHWNANANIKTEIASTFWTAEIALPLSSLESAAADDWRLNVLRKIHRHDECSYWSPTYDVNTPWWPHWRERMGILRLVSSQSSAYTENYELEEKFEISGIEVHGNAEISTPEILQLLPYKRGDVVTASELSWLKAELEIHDWFLQAHLETTDAPSEGEEPPTDSSINLQPIVFQVVISIRVTEMPTRYVQLVSLHNNRFLHSNAIRALFGLKDGRTSIQELETKCNLIATYYRNSGYNLAWTDYRFVGGNLQIDIDEGHLDEIRFVGNRRIQTDVLLDEFELKQGEIYNEKRCQSLIDELDLKLNNNKSYVSAVKHWQLKQDEDKNVLEIEVEERSIVNWDLLPVADFNRVHGVILGGGGEVQTKDYGGGRVFGSLSYGLSSETLNFHLGAEKRWFDRHTVRAGGRIHNLTGTIHGMALSQSEELLASLVVGDAYMDYYLRRGYQAWLKGQLTPFASIMLRFDDERHEILFTSTNWSLFNGKTPKKSNLRINEGHLRSFSASFDFDSRDHKSHLSRNFQDYPTPNSRTTRGWQGNLAFEYAGKHLQTDFDFTLYRFNLTRYNKFSKNHFFDFRLAGGFSDAPLPRQRQFYLGGLGTLRGYGFREFSGDNMLLSNLEYRYRLSQSNLLAIAAMAFLDTGYTWHYRERMILNRFNTSIGIGLSLGWLNLPDTVQMDTVRIEIARAIRKSRNVNFILRLSRMY